MGTLAERFTAQARRTPTATAIREPDRAVSYAALASDIDTLAGRLQDAGVHPGSRVAVAFPNGADFAASFFAAASAGAVVVPLNPASTVPEMAVLLADGPTAAVLASPGLAGRAEAALAAAGQGRVPVVVPEAGRGPGASTPSPARGSHARGDRPAICLYSSGTTGRPKRIERTHGHLLWEVDHLAAALGVSAADRILGAAPFCHTNGLMRSMATALLSGATLIPVAQFERRAVGRLIQREAVSIFIGVPFMFATLAETRWPEPVDLGSLRWCLSSSAPLRPDTFRRFRDRFGLPVRQLYGTTETGTIGLNTGPDPDALWDSVGRPLPGVDIGIFGDDGRPLGPDQVGDIGIRSPGATDGYPGLPDQTAASFRGGYFFPGDVGRKDGAGNVYLAGRRSLFINRGGFKVNPYEIEQLIEQHPSVREAAVVGVETDFGDQTIKAVVTLVEPCAERDIVDFCRGKLADFKLPSIVEFRPELPRTAAGKIVRAAL